MTTDIGALRAQWEEGFREKRTLIEGLDVSRLDNPTANKGWTVRNLATHVAIGSDGFLTMVAPKLAAGKGLLPVPLPGGIFKIIGNFDNGRQVKKNAKATPADLVKLMDEAHAKGARALDAVAADGWDRKGAVPTMGKISLTEFVKGNIDHDTEHVGVLKKALA